MQVLRMRKYNHHVVRMRKHDQYVVCMRICASIITTWCTCCAGAGGKAVADDKRGTALPAHQAQAGRTHPHQAGGAARIKALRQVV